MANKIQNEKNYTTNPQFSGGANVTGSLNGTPLPFTACGLYVGQIGTLVGKTIDGSVIFFVSASGFIPGLFTEVSSSSTCGSIVALR
jgi:hypothetical protein